MPSCRSNGTHGHEYVQHRILCSPGACLRKCELDLALLKKLNTAVIWRLALPHDCTLIQWPRAGNDLHTAGELLRRGRVACGTQWPPLLQHGQNEVALAC